MNSTKGGTSPSLSNLMVLLATLLVGCVSTREDKAENAAGGVWYIYDQRTDLCFATRFLYHELVPVPCSKEVIELARSR